MHAIAHRSVRTHVRESALKVDFLGEKCLAASGNRTCMTVEHQLHQLSYIPVPGVDPGRPMNASSSTFTCSLCPYFDYSATIGQYLCITGLGLLKSGHGVLNVRNDLRACSEGKTGTDESVHVLDSEELNKFLTLPRPGV